MRRSEITCWRGRQCVLLGKVLQGAAPLAFAVPHNLLDFAKGTAFAAEQGEISLWNLRTTPILAIGSQYSTYIEVHRGERSAASRLDESARATAVV